MEYKGIIITGTSGSGKSTIARELCKKFNSFQRVQAVTTRNKREDDANIYVYLNKEEFEKLEKENKLMVKSKYKEESYGITFEAFKKVILDNRIPVMVLTPESANRLDLGIKTKMNDKFLIIYLDADDEILDRRLKDRKSEINGDNKKQREIDRRYKDKMWNRQECPFYYIKNDNISIPDIAELIYYLYKYRNRGGLIPKKLIVLMRKCGLLLEDATPDNIEGASYDLRVGDEYFHDGQIKQLTDQNPFIIMKPGDYVLVSSKEIANLPKNVAGRFGISVSLFCKGAILSNGPQIDPGFRGRLNCLIFNTSNKEIQLKHGEHFATIEFITVVEHTMPYTGKYQGKLRMKDYIPEVVKASAINKLIQDVERLKRAKWFEKYLPLILSAFAIVANFVMGVILFFIKK